MLPLGHRSALVDAVARLKEAAPALADAGASAASGKVRTDLCLSMAVLHSPLLTAPHRSSPHFTTLQMMISTAV